MSGYPTFAYLLSKEYAVGLSYLCLSFSATDTNLFVSFAMDCVQLKKTNCVVDRRNSEFWQRIGQPYVQNLGRCFVAVVEIETDSCTVCLVELDAVQSEADIQANVR